VPATPENTITPRREIKNYQIKSLINLRYTALGVGRGSSAEVKRSGPRKGALHAPGKSVEVDVLFVTVAVGDVRFVTVP
jgi:hypothetical protein